MTAKNVGADIVQPHLGIRPTRVRLKKGEKRQRKLMFEFYFCAHVRTFPETQVLRTNGVSGMCNGTHSFLGTLHKILQHDGHGVNLLKRGRFPVFWVFDISR